MYTSKATALALLAPFILVSAVPVFKNQGTLDGWDGTNHEHKGTVSQVSDKSYKPDTAIKVVQIYDPSYTGRYHSEVRKKDVYRAGDEGYYGFAFRLDPDWDTAHGQTFNIAQFIGDLEDHPDNTCGDTWIPSMMLWVEKDRLRIRSKGGDMCDGTLQKFEVGTVRPGAWHRVVLQARWASDGSGYYKVWLDGEEALERSGIATTYGDAQKKYGFEFRAGLYANGWHDDKKMEGGQGTRQLWIDEVGIGNTYEDADPGEK
ncbi:polysaccharide lyase family 20 protein [Hypoxylon rubiginosum]|uniref:Polysaccharide lyase family 20 protein n=1 Tax=Hypoxylon rubiginosum TaxID=110542 RepID=A0ACB9ZHN8_9PEZI|nr:polysaccharide lyase family 20 protein [Hypoxylon rubiginosum]